MRHVPRIAVGTIQPGARRETALWGLVAALAEAGDCPVLFRSSFDLECPDASKPILGRSSRHLDSWAMSRSDAISALARAAAERDTAIVEGIYDSASTDHSPTHHSLDRLCEWLDLPRMAIVDVRALTSCRFSARPPKIDALLLDRVRDGLEAAYWQTTLEALWKTPVLGWLDESGPLRDACTSLAAGVHPPRDLCAALGERMLPTLRLDRLRQLVRRATPLPFEPEAWLLAAEQRRFRIAVAIDEMFCGYYPETLDLLEAAGAEICDFSPLRSEAVPDKVDVVYIGCGHPERDAHKLAANHCLQQSLRAYAAAGGRIYAEGGGLAYVCRELLLPGGQSIPMTGLLPATARWLGQRHARQPVELTFNLASWLAAARVKLRGYRHDGWGIEPRGPLLNYASGPEHRLDMLGHGNVIGSRVMINLAANRHLLRRFFEPYAPLAAAIRREFP
jgi:cobyrinic acid a,c-diamide synthase